MKRTIIVRVDVKDAKAYATIIDRIVNHPEVVEWRASSMTLDVLNRLRALGYDASWLRGKMTDALHHRSRS